MMIWRGIAWFFIGVLVLAGCMNLLANPEGWPVTGIQFALAAAIWAGVLRRPGRSADAVKREADAWLLAATQRGYFESQATPGLAPDPGEFCALQCLDAELQEFRSARRSLGAGSSIHVGRVPVYFGGATSRSVAELRSTGRGRLYLTTHRIVFSGAERSLEVRLKDLIAVEAYTDGLRLGLRSRERPLILTGFNGPLWAAMIGMLGSGQVTAKSFEPRPASASA
jgi:hypothetical protein